MAQNTYKSNHFKTKKHEKTGPSFRFKSLNDRRFQLAFGFFMMIAAFYLFTAFISYLFTGNADQSVVESFAESDWTQSGLETRNWLGLFGAIVAYYFIFQWFGIAALLIPPLLFIIGYKIVFNKTLLPPFSTLNFVLFFLFWTSLLFGFLVLDTNQLGEWSYLGGGIGYELALLFNSMLGWGTFLLLFLSLIVFIIYFFNITHLLGFSYKADADEGQNVEMGNAEKDSAVSENPEPDDNTIPGKEITFDQAEAGKENNSNEEENPEPAFNISYPENNMENPTLSSETPPNNSPNQQQNQDEQLDLEVEEKVKEEAASKIENYDPTLDLRDYKYPNTSLLNDYPNKGQVTKEELESNKDKIVETLTNFKIGIASIKATIGPTVTLYEIVPEAGIKISKIKNLEDDIALSLSALGIRIIAPIPGKGTIGIEVPNKNREVVSMQSAIGTEKFMKSDKELPIILGKTVSNELYITDLAKMPHLLMAGATGQGKSVALNIILASLIYKKHPSQLKFVLVDPKKVELTLFNQLERHFLAKLPNTEEAIITDTKKVVNTLNSLCMEMDSRYDLLKDAHCRNLKEYNLKFTERKLNPEKGHRFLPYIVLVIDELADLMMTAGKEIETPIARLAQLARAIGIHLVVATQRPSVNVITGIIKANFPARLSFRVTSKVDSRTILDTGGAEQLVGMGDTLLSVGSNLIRLQCPFVDTAEVENVCKFVGDQRGYESAYMLPEYAGEENDDPKQVDLANRDALFDDAARLIVTHQQGSTSLIQRKLKLGYNRAGRLIDQLEAAGVVGPFEGSKAREVLITDEYSLEQLLSELNQNKNS